MTSWLYTLQHSLSRYTLQNHKEYKYLPSVSSTLLRSLVTFDTRVMRQTLPSFNAIKQHRSPDELYGLFNRIFFIWINPILVRGYNNILTDQDSPCLSQNMKPELTRKAMLQIWSQRAKPGTKKSLPIALIKCLKTPFLAAIMPRLLLISFRYSQPTLINESIRYIVTYAKGEESNYGFWLIVSAFTIYVGLAVRRYFAASSYMLIFNPSYRQLCINIS
ncbi:hypothetical protein OCU04_007727 [Sclerotinia nivalis]|uniref:Uncharacterized protein n=1 Tax=Sclerotinia nivalis TaxID=352851 RepID=A0A9X0DKA1_9HELO|nr:hypothetical protein OCU04_007727 [Sclerotinia nivalis]